MVYHKHSRSFERMKTQGYVSKEAERVYVCACACAVLKRWSVKHATSAALEKGFSIPEGHTVCNCF